MENTFTIELDKGIKEINEETWPKVKRSIKKSLLGSSHFKCQPSGIQLLVVMGLDRHIESMKAELISGV